MPLPSRILSQVGIQIPLFLRNRPKIMPFRIENTVRGGDLYRNEFAGIIGVSNAKHRAGHDILGYSPPTDVKQPLPFKCEFCLPLPSHNIAQCNRIDGRNRRLLHVPSAIANLVNGNKHTGVDLPQFYFCFRVSQQYFGISKQDNVDAAVRGVAKVFGIDVFLDIKTGRRDDVSRSDSVFCPAGGSGLKSNAAWQCVAFQENREFESGIAIDVGLCRIISAVRIGNLFAVQRFIRICQRLGGYYAAASVFLAVGAK